MCSLPQWASAAIAARCGRILTPKLEGKWPDMPAEVRRLFTSAVSGAESAASQGFASEELQTIATEITKIVGVFEFSLRRLDKVIGKPIATHEAIRSSMPTNEVDRRIVRDILDVGARSARAATEADESGAYQEAMDAVSWTFSVLEDLQESQLQDHVAELNDRLHELCEVKKASRDTTVRWRKGDWDLTIPRRSWWRFW